MGPSWGLRLYIQNREARRWLGDLPKNKIQGRSLGLTCEPPGMELKLPGQYNGPVDSANGGYTCGRLANLTDSDCVEITLRVPPPLDKKLSVVRDGASLELQDEERTIAMAAPTDLELEVPRTLPSWEQVQEASKGYSGHDSHPFSSCFVCGPDRDPSDGLNIFAGPLKGTDLVAAPWVPSACLSDEEGYVRPEFLWCALDCPGAFAVDQKLETPRVLGRMVARLNRPIKVGTQVRVIGWPLGTERRKAFAGTALIDSSDRVCAVARAIWIAI